MNSKKVRALMGTMFLLVILGASTATASAQAIIKTPPAPVFTDAERQAELAKRRAAVKAKIGPDSVMILMSTEPRIYANDVDFQYRQENNLYYLTNLKKDGATLVLLPGNGEMTEVLFLPKRDPQAEVWNGKMYSREEAMRISGVKTVLDNTEFETFVSALKERRKFVSAAGNEIFNTEAMAKTTFAKLAKLYLMLPSVEEDDAGTREYIREAEFANNWKRVGGYRRSSGFRIENARPVFAPLRLVKSPMEIKLMQHAVDITTEAQMRAWTMSDVSKMEYEVQAEVEYIFRKRGADYWGYPSIVGCGPNATTLHYVESASPIGKNDLLLMDVGAEYDHYTADVTRTYPINGKFSKSQAEIYQIVYDSQEAVAAATKPGATLREVNAAGTEVIKQGLLKLGLITGLDDKIPGTELPQHRIWFMHGTSHWLGMNVHDVGGSLAMEVGSIFTNEPGIYIREDALDYLADTPETKAFVEKIRPAFEKYKNIGVRIEDDMLVTATGTEWMTKALPRTIEGIEAFIAKARKERKDFALNIRPGDTRPSLMATGGLFDTHETWSPFANNEFPAGVTNRKALVYSGKNAAQAGLGHTEQGHAE